MLKRLVILISVSFIIQNAHSQDEYPSDVSNFVEKRELCDHFRREMSGVPDIDDARNLNEQLDKHCKGTDKILKALRVKYKTNTDILEKLKPYGLIECVYNCSVDITTEIKFSDYPVVNITSNSKAIANFAGHYYVSTFGCGGGAICGKIVNINTNGVEVSFPNAYLIEDDNGENSFDVKYQVDSSLIVISGIAADGEIDSNHNVMQNIYRKRYYNFIDGKLKLLRSDIR